MASEIHPVTTASTGQRYLAGMFAADMKIGLDVQAQVGPWIAHLGSSASQPGNPAYHTARATGRMIVSKLRRPVATGGASGTIPSTRRGALMATRVGEGEIEVVFPDPGKKYTIKVKVKNR